MRPRKLRAGLPRHSSDARVTAGEITACEPRRLLAFRWREPGWQDSLDVAVRLAATGQRTAVTITETGFVRAQTAPALARDHEEGWLHHLGQLRRACERRADSQHPVSP